MECRIAYELITPPAVEAVRLELQKTHSKIDHADDDVLVDSYIKTARAHLEGTYNICCITQTWKMYLDRFPDEITIRKRPVQSITSVKYLDQDGVEQTLNQNVYQSNLHGFLARITPTFGQRTWPPVKTGTYNAVIVEFIAGFGDDPEEVSSNIIAALMLHAGTLYAHRETIVVGPPIAHLNAYEALIFTERVRPV